MPKADYTHPTPKWTKESIIAEIRANTVEGYCKSKDVGMSLTTMARRIFGSFDAALAASGAKLWSDRPRATCCASPGCQKPLRSGRAEHCEVHYYRMRRTGTLQSTIDTSHYEKCVYCGESADGRKYCDGTCRARHDRGTPLTIPCKVCATNFRPVNKNVCCSEKCLNDLTRQWSREHYARAMLRPEYRAKVRSAEYKRKAMKVTAFVEHVDVGVVFKRDKGLCWLCGENVNPKLKWPDLGFGTLDHIVPLIHGGMHSYGNIKLAHLSCNCKKGPRQIVQSTLSGVPAPSSGQAALF